MTISELLVQLAEQGIELWTEGGKLRFRAPKGALTPELRARLSDQKAELLDAVRERARQSVTQRALSYNQAGLWVINQAAPESAAYNVSFSMRICSNPDVPALRQAFQAIVDRHEILRTTYTMQDGKPLQQVHGYRDVDFEQVDVSGCPDDVLHQRAFEAYEEPFDLEQGSVMRVRLFTRSADDHVLLLVAHHIALDGWALWVLLDDLRQLYPAYKSGESISLPRPEATYADYVNWQKNLIESPEGERLWSYWQQQLAGELPTLDLPTDYARPLLPTYTGYSESFTLDRELAQQLRELARAEGATLYVVLLAAFQILLHRYTRQDDLVVGAAIFGRNRPEFATIVGHFVNVVPLRANFEGNPTFREFLSLTRHSVYSMLEHQDFPFPLMVEWLRANYDSSRSPIFQATFDVQRVHQVDGLSELFLSNGGKRVDFGGLEVEQYPMQQQEGQFDLGVQILETNDAMPGAIKLSSDLFSPETGERMAGYYITLLRGIVADPDQRLASLPLLTEVEHRQLLVEWNHTQRDYPLDKGVHELFEEQVERTPEAVAVMFEDEQVTYGELNRRANRLAHYLRSQGVGPEVMVGVFVERSIEMIVGLLGILKAGGAYVPLDPSLPAERLGWMIEDTGAPVIFTQQSLVSALPSHDAKVVSYDADVEQIAQQPNDNPINSVNGDNLAYVIFTSGSTGRPKGAQITHRGFTNFLLAMIEQPGITADDVTLAVTTISFDISGLEIYLPLIVGGRAALVARDVAMDGTQIAAAVEHYGVTLLQATPVTWRLLLEAGWSGRSGLKMLVGGEPLSRELAAQLLARGGELWDVYGPTETTVWCTVGQVKAEDGVISIGRPIANMKAYVLDTQLQPVPVGVPGVLWIGGVGVGRGYLKRPELNAERFIPDPFHHEPGAHMYDSGDLARWLPDGRLECLGRTDYQVKVRGYRIELGEIEAVLVQHEGVKKVVVVVREDNPGDKRLVAYYVPQEGITFTGQELRDFLKVKLPVYMVPSAFMALDNFPTTPSGKIDRRALPAPELVRQEIIQPIATPQTTTEATLVEIWKEVLETDIVSVYDNFFDLGGHSLQAMQVITKAQERIGLRMEPAMMRVLTLSQLAIAYDNMAMETAQPDTSETQTGRSQKLMSNIRRLVSKRK